MVFEQVQKRNTQQGLLPVARYLSCAYLRFSPYIGVIVGVKLLLLASGCSMMVATSGIGSVDEIPIGLTPNQMQERFGEPVTKSTTSTGRRMEIYRIRQRFHTPESYFSQKYIMTRPGTTITSSETVLCAVTLGMWCAVTETMMFPFVVAESELNRIQVAFVYGSDERVLYHYVFQADAVTKFAQATSPLIDPLLGEGQPCAGVKECVERYESETRLRAAEVGYVVPRHSEDILELKLKGAGEIDDQLITRTELIKRMSDAVLIEARRPIVQQSSEIGIQEEVSRRLYQAIHPRTDLLLKKINEKKCRTLTFCVAGYVLEIRDRAIAMGYLLTEPDKEVLNEELDIAQDGDAGKLSLDQASSRLQGLSTRHLVRLYMARQ